MRLFFIKALMVTVIALFFSFSPAQAASVIDQGKWGTYWKDTKNEYKDIVKEKKPSGGFFHTSGLDKALKKADKAYTDWDEDKGSKKKFEAFKKAAAGFSKARAKYTKTLAKALGKAEKGSLKRKGIKFLKRTLDQIQDNLDSAVELSRITVENDFQALSETAPQTARTFKLSLSTMEAGLTKLRAKPTVAMWEKVNMTQMCRDMVVAFNGAQRDKMDPPDSLKKAYNRIEKKSLAELKKEMKKFKDDPKWEDIERSMVMSQYKDLKALFKKSASYYKKNVRQHLK